jgi:hypothetical protein
MSGCIFKSITTTNGGGIIYIPSTTVDSIYTI